MSEFTFDKLKVVHMFIGGEGEEKFAQSAMEDLHPGVLDHYGGQIVSHAISPWPKSAFSYA